MLTKFTCSLCHKEKFECDVVQDIDVLINPFGELNICADCIKNELIRMVFERVGKREKESG